MRASGDRVDRYVLDRPLGRGGMGEVYLARDTRLGRSVALKLLPAGADAEANQRMLREARAAAAFEHPNAVTVFDVGEADGTTYIAMELVRGRTMRAAIGDETLSLERRVRWLVDVARALAAAHDVGLVHRDVKPDNVMIRDDGVVKVLDFGIARRRETSIDPSGPTDLHAGSLGRITEQGAIIGTPLYAAPEQLRGEEVDGRADVFAWGITAYELLCGRVPWTATDAVSLLAQVLSAEPEPLRARVPELPEEVAQQVTRAFEKRAAERQDSLADIADALEPYAEPSAPSGARGRSVPPSSRGAPPGAAATSTDTVALAATAVQPTPPRGPARRFARGATLALAGLGGFVVVVLAVSAVTGHLHFNLRGDAAEPARPSVASLGCRDASVAGDPAPEMARAIGVGACARLAAELGVPWAASAASHDLAVEATVSEQETSVTLAVGEARVTERGPTPIDAITAAVQSLSGQLTSPPPDASRIAAWGAKDASSARAIERVWRRMVLNLSPDDEREIATLVAMDPESPWPHAFRGLSGLRGTEAGMAGIERALALSDKLPQARAQGLRGLMLLVRASADRNEAMSLLRQAYREAPDDTDIAGFFAACSIAVGDEEEGFAVVDRLFERAPTRSVVPLNNAITAPPEPDFERDARYLKKLVHTFPEAFAWGTRIRHLVARGQADEARRALEFGRRFGMGSASADPAYLESNGVEVELAAFAPEAARAFATRMLADPRPSVAMSGTLATIASYLMEGRLGDAEAIQLREAERQRTSGNAELGLRLSSALLVQRRWAGRAAPSSELLDWMEREAGKSTEKDTAPLAQLRAEVALARTHPSPREAQRRREQTLEAIETAAAAMGDGERLAREGMLVMTLPLVRAVRGDAAAAKRYLETRRAPFWARRAAAFDAGLAFEAMGDLPSANRAYRFAQAPWSLRSQVLGNVVSRIRLAALLRKEGAMPDAAEVDEVVERLWTRADPGLKEAILELR